MEERRRERRVVLAQLGEDPRDAERVEDEVLAAAPLLALVRLAGEDEGALEQVAVDVRVVRRDLGEELLEELAMALGRRLRTWAAITRL